MKMRMEMKIKMKMEMKTKMRMANPNLKTMEWPLSDSSRSLGGGFSFASDKPSSMHCSSELIFAASTTIEPFTLQESACSLVAPSHSMWTITPQHPMDYGAYTSLILLRFDHTTTMVLMVLVVGDNDEGWESPKAQRPPLTSSFAYCT